VRKAYPYLDYDKYDFDVPVGTNGDNYDRFGVRRSITYPRYSLNGGNIGYAHTGNIQLRGLAYNIKKAITLVFLAEE